MAAPQQQQEPAISWQISSTNSAFAGNEEIAEFAILQLLQPTLIFQVWQDKLLFAKQLKLYIKFNKLNRILCIVTFSKVKL